MVRPVSAAATSRGWRAGAGAALLVLAVASCTPPPHAAAVKCSSSNIADVAEKKDCTVTIAKFDTQASARIKDKTRRRQAFVTGRFTVQHGPVRVELRGHTATAATIAAPPGNPGTATSLPGPRRPAAPL